MVATDDAVRARPGFTAVEMIFVMMIIGVLAMLAAAPAGRMLASQRVSRAAATLAGDLRLGVSLAARQRRPVVVALDPSTLSYQLQDRSTGAVLASRTLGTSADFSLNGMSANPASLVLFPGGMASGPLTVTLRAGTQARTVTMTRAGLVRVP